MCGPRRNRRETVFPARRSTSPRKPTGSAISHIRIVEHYFHHYGGYSPNPIVFLAAAAQRTRRARLVTGAVLPAFNHPLKLAGEIAMLDAISGGRLDVGFARAFLPHEFRRFGCSPDELVARFREGIEQVDLLLTPGERHPSRPLPPRSRTPRRCRARRRSRGRNSMSRR